ncbi:MAG: hypothetical protein JRH07_02980 [Deltaproteobacteria bacterium]|nr:hypothetical protein [Deltaproteobacteria bacterium]MBW2120796.1 hypothetical protein [Deltaproteobacteria bacterium]
MRDCLEISTDNGVEGLDIGEKIRPLQRGKALTCGGFSRAVSLQKSFLSQTEKRLVVRLFSTHLRIPSASDQGFAFFFQDPDSDRGVVVVRSSARKPPDPERTVWTEGVRFYQSPAPREPGEGMESFGPRGGSRGRLEFQEEKR